MKMLFVRDLSSPFFALQIIYNNIKQSTFIMKNSLFFSVGTLFLLSLAFALPKKTDAPQSLANAPQSTPIEQPILAIPTDDQCSCNDYFDGEPTYVTGTVHYASIPLGTVSCGYSTRVTLSYNALTVKNRFRILDGAGNIVATTAFVTASGQLTFCAQTGVDYYLQVSATSTVRALDRWSASVTCGPSC